MGNPFNDFRDPFKSFYDFVYEFYNRKGLNEITHFRYYILKFEAYIRKQNFRLLK